MDFVPKIKKYINGSPEKKIQNLHEQLWYTVAKRHNIPPENMEYDQILEKAGETGLYQIFIFSTLALGTMFYCAEIMANNFIAPHHEHWCKVEALQNLTAEEQKYISIPYNSEGQYSSCDVFDIQWENFTSTDFSNWNRSLYEGYKTKECSEYVFDYSSFDSTIGSEVSNIINFVPSHT